MKNGIGKINLKQGYCLIEPQPDSTSSFSSEHKKYDRKSIGTILIANCSRDWALFYKPNQRVIFNDNNSISIQINGATYEIIPDDDIVGIFEEEE